MNNHRLAFRFWPLAFLAAAVLFFSDIKPAQAARDSPTSNPVEAQKLEVESDARRLPGDMAQTAKQHEDIAIGATDIEVSLHHFGIAIDLQTRLGNFERLADNYNGRGLRWMDRGQIDEAEADFKQALAEATRSGTRIQQAYAYNNLGFVAQSRGNLVAAREAYEEAFARSEGTDQFEDQTWFLLRLSFIVNMENKAQEASLILDRAERLAKDKNLRNLQGVILRDRGWIALTEKMPEEALRHYLKAFDFLEDMAPADRGILYGQLGKTLRRLNRPEEAWDSLWISIELARSEADWGNEAGSWIDLCDLTVQFPRLDRDGASSACQQAGVAMEKTKEPHRLASHYRSQAQYHGKAGRLAEALVESQKSVQLVDSLRFIIPGRKGRSRYLEQRAPFFRDRADLLMLAHRQDTAAGHDLEAIGLSETLRARSLLDLWSAAGVDLLASADPRLRDQMEEKRQELEELHAKVGENVGAEISSALVEFDELDQRLRESSPAYRAAVMATPIGISEIRQLLDADTTVALLLFGEKQSHLFLVRREGPVASFDLGTPEDLNQAAKDYFAQLASPRSAPSKVLKTGQKLAQLLWGKEEERLAGLPQRLVFLGDGELQQFPIGALPRLGSTVKAPRYLAESFEVVHLPSLSLLREQRRNQRAGAPSRGALVLADPYYLWPSAQDLKLEKVGDGELRRTLVRRPKNLQLGRLAHADLEARLIASRFESAHRQLDLATGTESSKQRALSPDTGLYGILHFTSHGLLDPQHAELSALQLAEVDAEGRPVEGRLQLQDLYDHQLRAELVVASACQTAVGENLRLEGVGGLAQGFLQAGARRALVSLWQVESKSTAILMDLFYKHLLAGETPGRALQLAKVELMKPGIGKPRAWRSPFYWSGFVMIGDWTAFDFPEQVRD